MNNEEYRENCFYYRPRMAGHCSCVVGVHGMRDWFAHEECGSCSKCTHFREAKISEERRNERTLIFTNS